MYIYVSVCVCAYSRVQKFKILFASDNMDARIRATSLHPDRVLLKSMLSGRTLHMDRSCVYIHACVLDCVVFVLCKTVLRCMLICVGTCVSSKLACPYIHIYTLYIFLLNRNGIDELGLKMADTLMEPIMLSLADALVVSRSGFSLTAMSMGFYTKQEVMHFRVKGAKNKCNINAVHADGQKLS